MRIIICGGRDYTDKHLLCRILDRLRGIIPITCAITGAARGADRLGEDWARARELPYIGVPACWSSEQMRAGPRRNSRMLDVWDARGVIAFPGGVGTADMVNKGLADMLPVWRILPEGTIIREDLGTVFVPGVS